MIITKKFLYDKIEKKEVNAILLDKSHIVRAGNYIEFFLVDNFSPKYLTPAYLINTVESITIEFEDKDNFEIFFHNVNKNMLPEVKRQFLIKLGFLNKEEFFDYYSINKPGKYNFNYINFR
jgi:hypothetical protein